MRENKIDELVVGQKASFTKTVSESDVYTYAGVTGDFNPLHIDKEYAKNAFFKDRIAHGMFLAGLISAVFGTQLPGPGSIYSSQTLKFLAPVFFGDTITAAVEVISIVAERGKIILRTTCTNQDGKIVVDGEATVVLK